VIDDQVLREHSGDISREDARCSRESADMEQAVVIDKYKSDSLAGIDIGAWHIVT
jgi:hypothetical protein